MPRRLGDRRPPKLDGDPHFGHCIASNRPPDLNFEMGLLNRRMSPQSVKKFPQHRKSISTPREIPNIERVVRNDGMSNWFVEMLALLLVILGVL